MNMKKVVTGEWYWYSSDMYLKNHTNIYLVQITEKIDNDFYLYENEYNQEGSAFINQLFTNKHDAEKDFNNKLRMRLDNIKSNINNVEELLNTALRKKSSIYTDDEIEKAVFEKAKEMNLIN